MRKTLYLFLLSLITSSTALSQNLKSTVSFNDFSLDLYKNIKDSAKNFVISPLSIGIGLSMAYEGSGGVTQKQFEQLFHYSSNKQESLDLPDLVRKISYSKDSSLFIKVKNL